MAINITDGMSAVAFKQEIESKAIDKTGDDLGEYISIQEKDIDEYGTNDIVPCSFLFKSVNSLTLFLAYGGFTESNDPSLLLNTAFGSGCEDRVYHIGAQLWNYHTIIGDEATSTISGSGLPLKNCATLDKIKASSLAMSELENYPSLRKLVAASSYAKQRLGVSWSV